MRPALILLILCLSILVVGCMPNGNDVANYPGARGEVAGFWMGLWQGIICPLSWPTSLFTDTVNIYEVHNNGGWYNFGFVLGIGSLGGMRVTVSKKKRK